MLSKFFASMQRTGAGSPVKPLRLTAVEEDLTDHESLKTWERIIKDTIEHSSRRLLRMTPQDTAARLLKLEPTEEDVATKRLGGPTATVSALYMYLNAPNCTSGCIALAFQLEFVSFLSGLTRYMAINTSEAPVQDQGYDFWQVSTMLGYSLASVGAELCTRPQYSPPVIIIDTVRAFLELARAEMPEIQNDSQFLTGVVGITANNKNFEGTFVLHYPASLLGELSRNSNAEPLQKRTALRLSTFSGQLSRRS